MKLPVIARVRPKIQRERESMLLSSTWAKKILASVLSLTFAFYSIPAVALANELEGAEGGDRGQGVTVEDTTEADAETINESLATDDSETPATLDSSSKAEEVVLEVADELDSGASAVDVESTLFDAAAAYEDDAETPVGSDDYLENAVGPAGVQGVENGRYTIHSADVYKQVVDVMGGSKASGANVALYEDTGAAWQRFTLTWNGEGYYSIVSENSGLYLSCAEGASYGKSCNVIQATADGSDGQLWALVDAGSGMYKLQSKLTGLYLDVEGGHAGNTVNLQTWAETPNNNGNGQKFSFVAVPERTIADGTYAIECFDNELEVLDVMGTSYANGANVALYNNRNSINQKFRVEQLGNGYYMIMAEYTWQALDVVNGGTANGTNVTQWPQTRADNQQWIIQDAGDGWYYIISKCSGLYLDVEGGHAGNSVNIQTWQKSDNNGGRGQKFRFVKMVDNGMYYIASADNTNMVLDVTAGSRADGANVTLWNKTGASNQRWEVRQLYGRVYKISCYRSWRSLDVVNSGTSLGTNVTQWSQHDGKNQEWLAEVQDDGSVMFKSTCSDLYLDVAGGHAYAGANVSTWSKTNNNNGRGQRFYLQSYSFNFKGISSLVDTLDHVNGYGLQFTGNLNNLSDSVRNDLNSALSAYSAGSVMFMLIDLESGACMAYNGASKNTSASTIKGPYVLSLNMYQPIALNTWRWEMTDILHNSTNTPYLSLRAYWGNSYISALASTTHAYDFDWNANWVTYSPITLGKMWVGITDYLLSNRENSDWCRERLSTNNWITSRSALSWKKCTVYAKSGWTYGPDVHNEAYVVMDSNSPYLCVIMTKENSSNSWKMANLMNVLDRAHEDII